MGISVSILLITAGAILAFAVNGDTSSVNLNSIGWILLAVGAGCALVSLMFWSSQGDARSREALHVVERRQQADGRWLVDRAHDEALAFPFGESVGEPSRWNTLRALRVLRWYE